MAAQDSEKRGMHWPEFPFFDSTPIRDPSGPESPLYSDPDLIAIAPSARHSVFMGTRDGVVKEFDQSFIIKNSFRACSSDWSLNFVQGIPNAPNLVATVATQLDQPAELRIWKLPSLQDPQNSEVVLHSSVQVVNGTNTYPLTSFCMTPDLTVLAFGFADGSVVVVRGDLVYDRGSRQRPMYKASTAVTGLSFAGNGDWLYVASLDQVISVSTGSKLGGKSVIFLEKAKGAEYRCAAGVTTEDDDKFVVCRDTEISTYAKDKLDSAVEMAIPKTMIVPFKGGAYLAVVSLWSSQSDSVLNTNQSVRVMIFDTLNNLIAFNGQQGPGVKFMFEQWNKLCVVGTDGILYSLQERSLPEKLDLLKSQRMYQIAIRMASNENEKNLVVELHQDYADYLYERNDMDAALKHYIAAIGLGNTSHAIIRYKGSHHAQQLLEYLKTLFERDLATPQHLTLIVICYCKLEQESELESFLEKAAQLPDFDYEAAIAVLREARFFALAVTLAETWPDPDLAVDIKLRDMQNFAGCLDYVYTVSATDALRILIQNSRTLLNELPVETTGVLITLFTGKFVQRSKEDHRHSHTEPTKKEAAPVLQSYQAFINYIGSAGFLSSRLVSLETLESHDAPIQYQPPRPRLIFPSLVGHFNEFVVFLEACLKAAPDFQPSEKDLKDIVTALYEAYLCLAGMNAGSEAGKEWQARAVQLVNDHSLTLSSDAVLSLSSMWGFTPPPQLLVALGRSYSDVFRHKLQVEGDVDGALAILDDHLDDEPDMALQMVQLVCNDKNVLDKLRASGPDRLTDLFQRCVDKNLLSPVRLIQELSETPLLCVGDIRPFLDRYLAKTESLIKRQEKLAASYQTESDAKQEQLEELSAKPLVVQYGKCTSCSLPLDLPAVHFACKHSYHQRCLAGSTVCRECSPQYDAIETMRTDDAATVAKDSVFFDTLKKRTGRLRVVDDYISRGALGGVGGLKK